LAGDLQICIEKVHTICYITAAKFADCLQNALQFAVVFDRGEANLQQSLAGVR